MCVLQEGGNYYCLFESLEPVDATDGCGWQPKALLLVFIKAGSPGDKICNKTLNIELTRR